MLHQLKSLLFFFGLSTSNPSNLSLPSSVIILLLSQLQLLSLIFHPILLTISPNQLSKAINLLFHYLDPFQLASPQNSKSATIIIIVFCFIYFSSYTLLLILINLWTKRRKRARTMLLAASRLSFIHNKLLFFLIHGFFVKLINLNWNCSDSNPSFYCKTSLVPISIILIVINLLFAALKALFGYQIHHTNDTFGVKDNLYEQILFLHKTVVIFLYFASGDTIDAMIVLNFLGSLANFLILHLRLPMYNLVILKTNIICYTIFTLFSFTALARIVNIHNNNLLLFTFILAPIIVKLSLIKFRNTVWNILQLKINHPFLASHLPILLDSNLSKSFISPHQLKYNKATLFTFSLPDISSDSTKIIYQICIKEMLEVRQKHPNNELLALNIAKIYLEVFQDTFGAVSIINKLKENHLSLNGKISLQSLTKELSSIGDDNTQQQGASFLGYFVYKQKTEALKQLIKSEIQGHMSFWQILSSSHIDIMQVLNEALLIRTQTHKIIKHWLQNFAGQETFYINASLIYGIYSEVVHSFSSEGAMLIRKAYNSLHSKSNANKDIIDVLLGESAVIMASLEPDKLGRIIDVSSSVKELFKTTKKELIGANIGAIMPSIIASRHNNFLKRCHNKAAMYGHGFTRTISSYAKTLNDDYFNVDLRLSLSPLSYKGLNLVAYIKKMSDYQKIMIVDKEGFVVEMSKDLGFGSNIKIQNLCNELKKANHAFNLIHHIPKENELSHQEKSNLQCREDEFTSPTTRKLLQSLITEDSQITMRTSRTTSKLADTFRKGVKTIKEEGISNMDKEEAEDICQEFREGKLIKIENPNVLGEEKASFRVQIEPLIVEGQFYKVCKFRKESVLQRRKISVEISRTMIQKSFLQNDSFENQFPAEEERGSTDGKPVVIVKSTHPSHDIHKKEIIYSDEDIESKTPVKKASSIVGSQKSHDSAVRLLSKTLLKDEKSQKIKLAILLVYLAGIIIIVALCIDFVYTRKAIKEMADSMSLIDAVNSRLYKTISAWQAIVVLYARCVQLRPIDVNVAKYQAIGVKISLDMLNNGKNLMDKITTFKDEKISRSFYANQINLWEPLTHSLFNGESFDSLQTNNILTLYYLYISRYNESLLNLAHERVPLFAINNTVNDYLLTLETAVDQVTGFFEETKEDNVNLLVGIVVLESLLVTLPLILITFIIKFTITKVSKLLEAVSYTPNERFKSRLKQLENLKGFFEENIEDNLAPFNSFVWRENSAENHDYENFHKEKNPVYHHQIKNYKKQKLIHHVLQDIVLTGVMVIGIIIAVNFALKRSKKVLNDLVLLNDRVLTSYEVGTHVAMIPPTLYFAVFFQNETGYMIRNETAANQLEVECNMLSNANNIFLEILTNENNEITDPVIKEILDTNVCKYASTDAYFTSCIQQTGDLSFGLLGLHSKYLHYCDMFKTFTESENPTWDLGTSLAKYYGTTINNLHLIIFDAHVALSNRLVENFLEFAQEERRSTITIFLVNFVIVVVAMVIVRMVVLRRVESLNMSIRRIFGIIPYKMIEENKILNFYFSQEFRKELNSFKSFS